MRIISPTKRRRYDGHRKGGIAVITGIVLLVLVGFTALAIDLGYLMLSRTQMQAVSDSSSLAGGTELMPGLGRFATKTPAEVETAARPVAAAFAAMNRSADRSSTYIDQSRDIEFGQAIIDPVSGSWIQTLGAAPYNMIRVTVRRDQVGSSNGDQPIPLFFAQALGHKESTLTAVSAAAIMPAKGFTVSDEGEAAGVIPFAFKQRVWRRLEDAQVWYRNPDGSTQVIPSTYTPGDPAYPMHDPGDGSPLEPMFHRHAYDIQGDLLYDEAGDPIWEQDIFDNFHYAEPANPEETGLVSGGVGAAIPDGWLEVDLYPESTGGAITAGNAGTVDLGDTNNAANAIRDQILNGLTLSDYEAMEGQGILTDGQLMLDPSENIQVQVDGDTGISGGPIDQAMNQIIGETRAITLYDHQVVDGPGDTIVYTLTEFVGVRILYADLTGSEKHIWIQMGAHHDGTAVPDDDFPGPDTTVFTPLILIE